MARDDEAPRVSRFSQGAGRSQRPSKVVPFPGAPGEKVRLWAPSDEDDQLAEAEARKHLAGVLKLSALELSLAADGAFQSLEVASLELAFPLAWDRYVGSVLAPPVVQR